MVLLCFRRQGRLRSLTGLDVSFSCILSSLASAAEVECVLSCFASAYEAERNFRPSFASPVDPTSECLFPTVNALLDRVGCVFQLHFVLLCFPRTRPDASFDRCIRLVDSHSMCSLTVLPPTSRSDALSWFASRRSSHQFFPIFLYLTDSLGKFAL